MGRYAADNGGGGDFVSAPTGTHVARCIRITDLGTQQGDYLGEVTHKNQILVTWELCHELMDTDNGPQPFLVSKFYTNSLHEKSNLRKDLISWRGRDFTDDELKKFDLQSIIDAPCMLSIVPKGEGKNGVKVAAVMKVSKGTVAPPAKNPLLAFWLDEWKLDVFESLSDGIKKIIMKSPEYAKAAAVKIDFGALKKPQPGGVTSFDDLEEIPF